MIEPVRVFGLSSTQAFRAGRGPQTRAETLIVNASYATCASIDLGAATTGNLDNVIRAKVPGTAGNDIQLKLVADGSGAGNFTRDGNILTFHFEHNTTTITQFETAIGALSGDNDIIEVKTAGTGASKLVNNDALAATNLSGGQDTARRFHVGGHAAWSLHVSVVTASGATSALSFDYSNLPDPDPENDEHWEGSGISNIDLTAVAQTLVSGTTPVQWVRVKPAVATSAGTIWAWGIVADRQ